MVKVALAFCHPAPGNAVNHMMHMKNQTILNGMLAVSFAALAATQAKAATVTYWGSVADNAGNQVTEWRNSSTPKTADIDGNNVYGTFGAVIWGDGANATKLTPAGTRLSVGESATGVLGWSLANQTVNPDLGIGLQNFQHAGYVPINNLAGTGFVQPGVASISPGNGTVTISFNGLLADYAGQTLRFGVMQDYQEGSAVNDVNKQFTLTQTAGLGSGSASFTTPGTRNQLAELYFFDITGIAPGDQFTLTGFANPATTGQGGLASIGTLTFDMVPEPSTAAIVGLGLSALLCRPRRRS